MVYSYYITVRICNLLNTVILLFILPSHNDVNYIDI